MKKNTVFILMLILFSWLTCSQNIQKATGKSVQSALRKIEVKSPNGGEEWWVGKEYQVRWQEQGIIGEVKIILCVHPSGPQWQLGTVKPGKKHLKYFYRMMPEYAGHNMYKIKVSTLDNRVYDMSNRSFSIKKKPVITQIHPTKLKTIKLIRPDRKSPPRMRIFYIGEKISIKFLLLCAKDRKTKSALRKVRFKLEGYESHSTHERIHVFNCPKTIYMALDIPRWFGEEKARLTVSLVSDPSVADRVDVYIRSR